ncbi:MAG: PQQ-binding-like beta-propeller repeat protein, partial [Bacteroidetes bacterium]|nr:PQQ-binding-like beta-propeller repeat protein [Bacteroidota bacterium]
MKKLIVFLAFTLSFLFSSKAQQYNYVKKIAGTSNDRCNDIVSDKAANIYFCGTFTGYLGIANLLSLTSKNSDAFIVKMDTRSGKPLWAKGSTGTSNEGANAIAIDKSGNLYVAGVFNSNVKFDNTTTTGNGLENMFIAKFNPQGGLIWLKMAGGAAQTRVTPKDLKIGDDNNIYITGSLRGTVNFGNISVKSSNPNLNTSDVFVAKYDTSGTSIWINSFGKSGLSEGNGIETDINGNIYVGGTHSDTLIAGSDTLVGNNFYRIFVLALDKNGKHRWLNRYTNLGGSANAVKMNNKGQIFVAGESNRNAFLMEIDTTDGKSKWFKETKNAYTSAK